MTWCPLCFGLGFACPLCPAPLSKEPFGGKKAPSFTKKETPTDAPPKTETPPTDPPTS